MNPVFEQAQRFTEMWTDFATKMATTGLSVEPDAPPPDATRQVRGAIFRAMSEWADQFLRSPEFLQMVKQGFDRSMDFRQQMNDMLTTVQHNFQGVARQDVDNLLMAVHHLETRLLDRVEQLSSRLDEIEKRLPARGGGAGPRRTPRRRSPVPPRMAKSASSPSTAINHKTDQEPGVTDEKR